MGAIKHPPNHRLTAVPGLHWLPWLLAALWLAACDRTGSAERYDCSVLGERFRYRAGERQGPGGIAAVRFRLRLQPGRKGFDIEVHPALTEMGNPKIVLNAAQSTPAEAVYQWDHTDPATQFRSVSSLVLNRVSGDVRLFHHHWIPPVQWRDSDQYLYTGSCRKL